MEEDQNSEVNEVTPQDTDSTIVEQDAPVETADETLAREDSSQDRNWGEMRRKEREAQDKIRMQEEFIKGLMQSQQAQSAQQAPPPPEVDEFADVDPTDFPNYEATQRMIEKKAEKIVERKVLELEKKRNDGLFRERLNAKYSDFDEIVNPETIAILDEKEPELSRTIAKLSDPYDMGLQTYNFIKAMNYTKDSSKKRHAKEVVDNIEKNEKSIQSPQAYDKRPMAQAFSMSKMSDGEKTKLYEEMMGFAGQTSGY